MNQIKLLLTERKGGQDQDLQTFERDKENRTTIDKIIGKEDHRNPDQETERDKNKVIEEIEEELIDPKTLTWREEIIGKEVDITDRPITFLSELLIHRFMISISDNINV